MHGQECIPFAPTLIESMRSLGYSFPTAIADLLDNSISAKAKTINIYSIPSEDPSLIILDDGHGMSKEELYEAMRYGSSSPLAERTADDLGRFGLGLKAASLSQCRSLLVVSKQNGQISAFCWDLDYIIQNGSWMLQCYEREELDWCPRISFLDRQKSGTYILLRNFDRIKESTIDIHTTFAGMLDMMSDHLALVFHRYMAEDRLIIRVNDRTLEPMDPFLSEHPATQKKKEQPVYISGEKIILKPYILPHASKLSIEDLKLVGGKERLRNDQGFYIYRNRRLIIWGTWFRMERKDELNKLARVRVDIPNTLDYMWSIDVKKSSASLPDIIKKNMFAAISEAVAASITVHTHRGKRESAKSGITYVWERVKLRDGCYKYAINEDVAQIKAFSQTLSEGQQKLFLNLLHTLEDTFPSSALYVDAAKNELYVDTTERSQVVEGYWEEIQLSAAAWQEKGRDVRMFYEIISSSEPYVNYEEIKGRIKEELETL